MIRKQTVIHRSRLEREILRSNLLNREVRKRDWDIGGRGLEGAVDPAATHTLMPAPPRRLAAASEGQESREGRRNIESERERSTLISRTFSELRSSASMAPPPSSFFHVSAVEPLLLRAVAAPHGHQASGGASGKATGRERGAT